MTTDPKCPKCGSENVYPDGNLWICPECANEWSQFASDTTAEAAPQEQGVRDAHGNVLADGGDGHDIACKIDGIGAINLKSEFVKKV